jgi:hypothetical protein
LLSLDGLAIITGTAPHRTRTADGSCRFIRKDVSEATLRAVINRNGGEELGADW